MARFLILAASVLVAAAPALAQQPATDAAAASAVPAAAPVKPRKICRTSQITGRRIAQSQCYTAAQWAEYDRVQAEAASQLINDVTGRGARANLRGDNGGGLSTSSMFGLGPPQ